MRKFDLSLRSSRSSYFATFRHQLTILSKTDALVRRSGLICLARSSRTGLDMSHILFMVEILLLTKCRSEERFSRNAETDLVCRLLLEKKKKSAPSVPPPTLCHLPYTMQGFGYAYFA